MDEVLEDSIYNLRYRYRHPEVEGAWYQDENGVWIGPRYHLSPLGFDSKGRLRLRIKNRRYRCGRKVHGKKEIDLGLLGSLIIKIQSRKMKRSDISDLQVCIASRDFHDEEFNKSREAIGKGIFFITDLLVERTGAPYKVCEAALKRTKSRGLIECVASLRTGWLTPKGKKFLETSERRV